MKINKWTIILFLIIVIDSITTFFVFEYESNFSIVWVMELFNLNLAEAMVARVFYCLPLLFLVNLKIKWSRLTCVLYSSIWTIGYITGLIIEYVNYGNIML